MRYLFPIEVSAADVPAVPGLSYLPDYITEQEESELAGRIDEGPWDTAWQRRRQLFGATYGSVPDAEAVRPIPSWGQALAERMHREVICEQPFNQMLVNEYLPGQGIALHRDYQPFARTVVSLSLLAPVIMEFRHARDEQRAELLLLPRSLLVLSDEARYDWQHGIARRMNDSWKGLRIPRARRLSITFRLRPG